MKHPIRTLLSPVLAFSMAAFTLHAQAPAGGDPFVKGSPAAANAVKSSPPDIRNCFTVLEVYSLDKNDAFTVLDSERGSAARLRRVTELANTGKAHLEILTALTTKSGQRAVCESVDEVRYPAGFVPPQNKDGFCAPSEMSVQKLGDSFEMESSIQPDGRICDLNFALSRTCLAGFRDIPGVPGGSVVFHPQFNSQKILSGTMVSDGEPHYVGSFSSPTSGGIGNGGAASKVWLAFVHLSAQKALAEAPKPPVANSDWSAMQLEYTCFSLDKALARELLTSSSSVNAPWEKLQALIGEKKARFEDVMTVNARPGQRATTQETQEFFYANDYNPAQYAGTAQNNRRTTTSGPVPEKKDDPVNKEAGKGATTSVIIESSHSETAANKTSGAPNVLMAMSLGVTLEIEPVVNPDGLSVDLNHDIQSVTYLGDLKATGAGERYAAEPIFQTRRITTSQTIPIGRRVLVSTLNSPGADGVSTHIDDERTFLLFVRVTPNDP